MLASLWLYFEMPNCLNSFKKLQYEAQVKFNIKPNDPSIHPTSDPISKLYNFDELETRKSSLKLAKEAKKFQIEQLLADQESLIFCKNRLQSRIDTEFHGKGNSKKSNLNLVKEQLYEIDKVLQGM
jgi:hypothetical protein